MPENFEFGGEILIRLGHAIHGARPFTVRRAFVVALIGERFEGMHLLLKAEIENADGDGH